MAKRSHQVCSILERSSSRWGTANPSGCPGAQHAVAVGTIPPQHPDFTGGRPTTLWFMELLLPDATRIVSSSTAVSRHPVFWGQRHEAVVSLIKPKNFL